MKNPLRISPEGVLFVFMNQGMNLLDSLFEELWCEGVEVETPVCPGVTAL